MKRFVVYHCKSHATGNKHKHIFERNEQGKFTNTPSDHVIVNTVCTSEHDTYLDAQKSAPRIR